MEWIIAFLLTFFVGYVLGRRLGRKEGYAEAAAVAPVIMRQQSLENGICILCQNPAPQLDKGLELKI